jgi:hypothetical protein
MSFRRARHFAWILALLPFFGCRAKDLRGVISEHKSRVEPKLALLPKIRDLARSAPAVTVDHVEINGPGPKIGVVDIDEMINAAIEYIEDLEDSTAFGNVPHRILGSGSLNRCAAILANHRYPYDPLIGTIPQEIPWYVADSQLRHCVEARYVFVIRSLGYSSPTAAQMSAGACPPASSSDSLDGGVFDAGSDDAGVRPACKVFNGGYLNADVLVFDLEKGTHLGGFRFTAESSPKVDIAGHTDTTAPLYADFSLKLRLAFHEAAQKHVPSFSVGY